MALRSAAPGAALFNKLAPRAQRIAAGAPTSEPPGLTDALALLCANRHDALLEAVAMAAQELLRSSDLSVSLPKVAERIGQATGVDRAHIFLVDESDHEGRILSHHVWAVSGLASTPEFQNATAPMAEVGLKSWIPRFKRGETIVSRVRDFDSPERALFNLGGVQSVLSVPVLAEGHWLGMIGFDDCHTERDWSAAEIDTIKTVAELVGAAVARTTQMKTLADANRIIENSSTILYRLSPQKPFDLIYLSQNVRRYGYDARELLASPGKWLGLIDREFHPTIAADIKSILEKKTEYSQVEFTLKKTDGSSVWFEGRAYALRNEKGDLIAIEGILTDITERKHAAEKIATLARTDSLTGLPNRGSFLDRLKLEFARAKRDGNQFAVHYLDLDHFKDVNDTLGHPVGDKLLCLVADRLKACVRETDMVARFGGDEFAVLQDAIADAVDVETLASKIGEAVGQPYTIGGNQLRTTASIGIVPYNADIAGPDAMLMKADLALYRAKNEGRNQFRFHIAELDELTRERMLIGEELRHAVTRNEFELFYQPQVDLRSGWIVGLEALIRWNHPKRGLMLPDTFIPIAETTGSIVPIGEWVIEKACRQIREWSDLHIAPPVVAVNLSGAQFKLAPSLDRMVAKYLARFNIPPNQLELELTETVLMETKQKYSSALDRLREIGVRLAIDDFGTGYSSLDYLRSFRVSRLKIDRRFISSVTTNSDDATIVRATVGLAHALGIEVIAEGVETVGQRDFLIAAGCTLGQGFYFGRPAPAAIVGEQLRRNLQFSAL